jgi:hypothetical protein
MAKTQRALFFLVLCLGSPLALYAQTHPPLDVSITSIESQNGKKHATLHVQNNSGKDVAAFTVAYTLKYANGEVSTSQSQTHDYGYRATRDGDRKHGIPKLLAAGESVDLPALFEKNVVEVEVKFAAVVYADRTAEGDPEAIGDIQHGRQKFAEQLKKAEPENAAAASSFAKDDLRCGKVLCSTLRRQP